MPQELVASIDEDGNGNLSFVEFVRLMEKDPHADGDLETEIREAFRVFDTDGYGYIAADDLAEILTTMGDKLTLGQVYLYY